MKQIINFVEKSGENVGVNERKMFSHEKIIDLTTDYVNNLNSVVYLLAHWRTNPNVRNA